MAINTYPLKKYNYRVQLDNVDVAGFSEVSGFDASIDVIEYREGTERINSPRKMPGLTKYGNVTLKWGMTSSMSFFEWVQGISNGEKLEAEDRCEDIVIYLQDDSQADVASWTLINAWPSKYVVPDFNASSSEVSIESVEIVFEEMMRNQ
ncbi:MAG: phage tail protein [Defluviitaleaceae bacterium]|nr:phage tail protein [Defluviitaleaceae bacterium]